MSRIKNISNLKLLTIIINVNDIHDINLMSHYVHCLCSQYKLLKQ